MKQLKVGLPDYLREWLERAAAASGRSLAEEVRMYLQANFESDVRDPETRALVATVGKLADLVKLETGQKWHEHPAANCALRRAITARLARLKPEGEAVFRAEELPKRRLGLGSDDPEVIGLGLEIVDFYAEEEGLEHKMFESMHNLQQRVIRELQQRDEDDKS